MNQWVALLESTELSQSDRDTLARFEKDPVGRGFLPVGDLLYSKGFINEAIELLMEGVERHPKYSVARVILGKYLYDKGMFVTSWKTLNDVPVSLSDNLLAQHILFRLALILGEEKEARRLLSHMKDQNLIDHDIEHLNRTLQVEGIKAVKEFLLTAYHEDEIELPKENEKIFMSSEKSSESLTGGVTEDYSKLGAFHVVPLKEIFAPSESSSSEVEVKGVELDSTTLADIYEKQHHFGRALEIYRRLLRVSPSSDLIRRKISELSKKKQDLENSDLGLSPDIVDNIEDNRTVDSQISMLEGMLEKLGDPKKDM